MLGSPLPAAESSCTPKNQRCLHVGNFLKLSDWVTIRTMALSRLQRAQVISNAGIRIGIKNPIEKTLFRMVSLLAYGEGNWDFSQGDVFKYMTQIQTFIKEGSRKTELPYMVDYPVNAMQLTEALQAAFEGDIPPEVAISELDQILAGRNLRGRPKTDPNDPEWVQHLPSDELREKARQDIYMFKCKAAALGACKKENANESSSSNFNFSQLLPSHVKTEPKPELKPGKD
jgi:hypothetical protein